MEPLVWNKQTGVLVGGHQRITILDEEYEGKDYTISVSVVDLDPARERELNVILNNPGAQGQFDDLKLAELFKFPGIDVLELGFDRVDLEMIEPDTDWGSVFSASKEEDPTVQDDIKQIEAIQKMKELKKQHKAQGKIDDDAGFTLHVIFASTVEMWRFVQRLDLVYDAGYVDGRSLAAATNVDIETALGVPGDNG